MAVQVACMVVLPEVSPAVAVILPVEMNVPHAVLAALGLDPALQVEWPMLGVDKASM